MEVLCLIGAILIGLVCVAVLVSCCLLSGIISQAEERVDWPTRVGQK